MERSSTESYKKREINHPIYLGDKNKEKAN